MKKKKIKPYPRTRSTDPVVILQTVAKAILDEPKRYHQGLFISHQQCPDPRAPRRPESYPTCGTMACVAGWIAIVTGQEDTPYARIAEVANRAIGGDVETDALFDGGALPTSLVRGTRAYAKAGVRHIARFVKETWGKELGVKV